MKDGGANGLAIYAIYVPRIPATERKWHSHDAKPRRSTEPAQTPIPRQQEMVLPGWSGRQEWARNGWFSCQSQGASTAWHRFSFCHGKKGVIRRHGLSRSDRHLHSKLHRHPERLSRTLEWHKTRRKAATLCHFIEQSFVLSPKIEPARLVKRSKGLEAEMAFAQRQAQTFSATLKLTPLATLKLTPSYTLD